MVQSWLKHLVFHQLFYIYQKFSFQSHLTPSNFIHSWHSLFSVSYSPISMVIFSLLLICKWHLPGLLFKRLLSNDWNKTAETSSNELIRSSILSATTYGVLQKQPPEMFYKKAVLKGFANQPKRYWTIVVSILNLA